MDDWTEAISYRPRLSAEESKSFRTALLSGPNAGERAVSYAVRSARTSTFLPRTRRAPLSIIRLSGNAKRS